MVLFSSGLMLCFGVLCVPIGRRCQIAVDHHCFREIVQRMESKETEKSIQSWNMSVEISRHTLELILRVHAKEMVTLQTTEMTFDIVMVGASNQKPFQSN